VELLEQIKIKLNISRADKLIDKRSLREKTLTEQVVKLASPVVGVNSRTCACSGDERIPGKVDGSLFAIFTAQARAGGATPQ
jgi:hypothetical protein